MISTTAEQTAITAISVGLNLAADGPDGVVGVVPDDPPLTPSGHVTCPPSCATHEIVLQELLMVPMAALPPLRFTLTSSNLTTQTWLLGHVCIRSLNGIKTSVAWQPFIVRKSAMQS